MPSVHLEHRFEQPFEAASGCALDCGGRLGGHRLQDRIEHGRGALAQARQRVSALEQECETAAAEFLGELPHDGGHRGEASARELHVGERVIGVGVESARDQHEIRSKRLGRGDQDSLEDPDVLGITAAGRHRDVERVAVAAAAATLRRGARPGVVGELVGRDVEDTRIVFE